MATNNIEIIWKKKNGDMVVDNIKISQKMKNESWLSIGKIILKCTKILILKI